MQPIDTINWCFSDKRKPEYEGALPLHIPSLSATEGQDTVFRKNIETEWIDTLLVDDNETLPLLLRVDGLVTNKVLELNDLLDLLVSETPF